ncbi:hypothetical protein IG631_18849 [Alternaria alternata]|nr:hypothetical protein IG631_18849 [Alternaria alternata]
MSNIADALRRSTAEETSGRQTRSRKRLTSQVNSSYAHNSVWNYATRRMFPNCPQKLFPALSSIPSNVPDPELFKLHSKLHDSTL